jgi:hypothetical protein
MVVLGEPTASGSGVPRRSSIPKVLGKWEFVPTPLNN